MGRDHPSNTGLEGQSDYFESLLQSNESFHPCFVTAASRAIESLRNDSLFKDDLAIALAGQDAISYVQAAEMIDESRPYVAVRTRYLDEFLIDCLQRLDLGAPYKQIVILGAGMDARAFRIQSLLRATVYEIDKKNILDQKISKLKDIKPIPYCSSHILIDSDLTVTEDWSSKLLQSGFQPDLPSIWMLEGILMYLTETEVNNLLEAVSQISAPNSRLGADLINRKAVQGREGSWSSGFDNPETLFYSHGWDVHVIQPGEEGADFGRYIRKLPHRETPDIERAFFVKAVKN